MHEGRGMDTSASIFLQGWPGACRRCHDAIPISVSANASWVTYVEPATRCRALSAGVELQEADMPHTSRAVGCVVNGAPNNKLSTPDAVVIVVITVLAGVMSGSGLEAPTILAVLGGASLVAAGTLFALRGGGNRLGSLIVRVARAIPAP
jgi:hypothetical protein